MSSTVHRHPEAPELTPEETEVMMRDRTGLLLLDVRTEEEFAGGHIEGARLLPVQELGQRLAELEPHRRDTVIAYCRSGHRSGVAAAMLHARGYRALNMTGGIIRWSRERRPVVRGGQS